ncbi:hypothetical protein F3157_20280 [Virgibacillus dakarensis]|uniref:hypothetical protein n=1 Tax=Virgibacillus dakarensis TaxID=1917889 RepID=UPI00111CD03B|nr:hypothetical protein [Virgibacillus dakarensis]MTW87953.1 hypothetical protein [Virgibacillus dakarensis]
MDLDILLFIISYILLDIIGSVFYVGALLLSFKLLKMIFNMNADKWNALFKSGKGVGFYFMMLFPYLIMLVVMFSVSKVWFELINFEYSVLGSLSVVILLTLIVIFAFPKLRDIVNNKLQEND